MASPIARTVPVSDAPVPCPDAVDRDRSPALLPRGDPRSDARWTARLRGARALPAPHAAASAVGHLDVPVARGDPK